MQALIKAGLTLSSIARSELECGDYLGALIDAIAETDNAELRMPTDVVEQVRQAFESMSFRPGSSLPTQVNQALTRIEARTRSTVDAA